MNVRLFGLFTIAVLVAGSLGYSVGQRSKASSGARTGDLDLFGTRTRNLLEIERAKIIGLDSEWLRRFNTAYSTQPPEVGIWEGTNLLTYLTGKAAVVPTGSFENDVMLTHAKLGGLYLELGATNEAELHFEAAIRIMQEKHPGLDFAKAKEGLKRFSETNRASVLKEMPGISPEKERGQ